jgi:6-phosphogluconolactonase
MSAAPEVVVSDSAAELARGVAERAAQALAAAVAARGEAHLVITGGGILEKVLAALTEPTIEWPRVHVWWGDERYVAADSDERNEVPARRLLLDHVDVDPDKVHPMPAADAGFPDVEAAADDYAGRLAAHDTSGVGVPAFDVVLLGVGPDGHCCSLFPGHPGTQVRDRTVIAVHDSPKPPPTRLSLTFPALDAAREIWFVVSGEAKADAVARALSGVDAVQVPSSAPRGTEHTLWFVDEAAAAQLPR